MVDQSERRSYIIYKGNEDSELAGLMYHCDDYLLMDEKEAKSLAKVNRLDEAIQFLNSCK